MAPDDMLLANLAVKPPPPVEECHRSCAFSICADSAYQIRSGAAVSCGQLQPHHGRCTEFDAPSELRDRNDIEATVTFTSFPRGDTRFATAFLLSRPNHPSSEE
jgi:hypothetical protein